jgi:peptide/nickel transport system ATP-binding protein/oligopeptide transport system ATP-binding protein
MGDQGLAGAILEIKGLTVRFPGRAAPVMAVNGVDLSLRKGETLGVVGESGCGKSVMLSAVMRLLEAPPAVVGGQALYRGLDLLSAPMPEVRKIRGKEIAMIFQEPMTSLNPVIRVGDQVAEAVRVHEGATPREARARAEALLRQVEIPQAHRRMRDFPHQLSGGMRQRVMIAMALACNPLILLADEPTTALDVTIQAQILALLRKLKREYDMGVVLVTHDLGVIAEVAERVAVFYGGRVVEQAATLELFDRPLHPYTEGLLSCIPPIGDKKDRLRVIEGSVPDPSKLPPGCAFHPRCARAVEACRRETPALAEARAGHFVACHLAGEGA